MSMELKGTFNYHDFQSMKQLNTIPKKNSDDNLSVVAKQLESVFLQMVVKSMREANETFQSDFLNGQSGDFYKDMYDKQLTLSLSQGKGVGLAEVIESQLKMSKKINAENNMNKGT
jgi:flagellar protein FlgJ